MHSVERHAAPLRRSWPRRHTRTLSLLLALFSLAPGAVRATTVSGNVSGVWDLAGSPYVVIGPLLVPGGQLLAIDAGVTVRFGMGQYMVVAGTLRSAGTAGQPVLFTSDAPTPAPGDWYGVLTASGGRVAFSWTRLRFGGRDGQGLLDATGRASAVSWQGGGASSSAGMGIRVLADSCQLSALAVNNNRATGLVIDAVQPAQLADLDFQGNAGVAVDVVGNPGSYPASLTGSGNGLNGIRLTGTIGGTASGAWLWEPNASFPCVVNGRTDLPVGHTLTLGPGAVVKYLPASYTYINGTWRTLGTTDAPCWITSWRDDAHGGDTNGDGDDSLPVPGEYYGPIINVGAVAELRETWLAYGGKDNYANLSTDSGVATRLTWHGGGASHSAGAGVLVKADSVEISRVTFAENAADGLDLWPTHPATLDNLVARDNGRFGLAVHQCAGNFPATLTGWGNGMNGLYLTGPLGGAESPATWTWGGNPDFPYLVANVDIPDGVTLQVSAGAVVKYLAAGWSYVYGTLRTLGTPTAPVRFTSRTDDAHGGDSNALEGVMNALPGSWYGVIMLEGSTFDLSETHFDYGGMSGYGSLAAGGRAAHFEWRGGGAAHGASDGADVSAIDATLDHLAIQGNYRHGLSLDTTLPPVIDEIRADNNRYDAISITGPGNLPATLGGAGNGLNGVRVGGMLGGAAAPGTWLWDTNPLFPPVLANLAVPAGATLTIGGASVVKGAPGGYLNVFGTLRTLPDEGPIWFTSLRDDGHGGDTNDDLGAQAPLAGDWYGLLANAGSTLDLTDTWIGYPGQSGYAGVTGGWPFELTWQGGGVVHSGGAGINATTTLLQLSGLRLANNASHGALLNPTTAGTVSGCDLVANGLYGMANAGSAVTLDARDNWWGHATGPLDSSPGPPDYNPAGQGQPVSDYVTYRSWRAGPATNIPPGNFALLNPLPEAKVPAAPVQFHWGVPADMDGDAVTFDLTVDDDPGFGSPALSVTGLTTTTYTTSGFLTAGLTWYWRVVARDGRGGATYGSPLPGVFHTVPAVSGVGDGAGGAPVVVGVTPNPTRGAVELHFWLNAAGPVRVEVLDVRGHLVRVLSTGFRVAGRHAVSWEGFDARGVSASSGIYFFRVITPDGRMNRRFVRLK